MVRTAASTVPVDLLNALHARRAAAAAARPGSFRKLTITPTGRLVVGHGEDSVLESNLTLSTTYGLPIIPGSALKGACAAQARRASWRPADVLRVFGGPRPDGDSDPARCGSFEFWDALPLEPPRLVVDVLTPHVQPYYEQANSNKPITQPPAEYHNPNVVRFLAVERTPFGTVLTGPDGDLDAVVKLLKAVCEEWGLGGKTAAGYGYCDVAVTTDDGGER